MRPHTPKFMALAAALLAMVVAGCGGASDEVGGSDAPKAASDGGTQTKLSLVAYAVPKVGFDKVIPAFNATPEGYSFAVPAAAR